MATTPTSTPAPKTNRIGLTVLDYRGGKTTLCAGCGHNAVSERIIDAMYEMGVQPEGVVKLSGIGCSSKSPAYFLNRAHGFNAVHGRMPSVATGVALANSKLMAIGVTGDGADTFIGKRSKQARQCVALTLRIRIDKDDDTVMHGGETALQSPRFAAILLLQ